MMPLEETPSLIAQVYQRLLDAIADHTLAPGSRIRQGELAERLAVSRQPISHALHLLHRQGLVMEAGRKGFRVTPLDPDHILRLYEVRSALDGLAARLAASGAQRDRASRRKLEDALQGGQRITSETAVAELVQLDVAFHRALYEISGNPVIEETIGPQWAHMRRSMAYVLSRPGYPMTVWEEHTAIAERVFAGDAEGAECMAKAHALAAGRMTEERLRAVSEAA
jgi:DNA-binding GntR family transcriptional regulator